MKRERRLLILTRRREGAPFRQRIEPYIEPLAHRGILAEVAELARSPLARRRQLRRGADSDGVLIHRKTLTAWDGLWLRGARRVIYDVDDAVMFQARRPDQPHTGRTRKFRRTVGRSDLVIVGSAALADHARQAGARELEIIPTGLDVFGRYTPKRDHDAAGSVRLVWIGSASTLKQVERTRDALEAVGRRHENVILRVIADAELKIDSMRVENVPWSRDTEADLLAECDVGIAPMPDTPYTRGKCAFKIAQYMAAGLPVIASPVGANARYVRHGETGLHATKPAEWAAAVERLVEGADLRRAMGAEGRRRAETELDVSVLAPRVCDLLEDLLA